MHVGPGVPGRRHRRVDGVNPAAGPKGNVVVGVLAKEFKSVVVLARKHAGGQALKAVGGGGGDSAHVLKLFGEAEAVKALRPKHFGGIAEFDVEYAHFEFAAHLQVGDPSGEVGVFKGSVGGGVAHVEPAGEFLFAHERNPRGRPLVAEVARRSAGVATAASRVNGLKFHDSGKGKGSESVRAAARKHHRARHRLNRNRQVHRVVPGLRVGVRHSVDHHVHLVKGGSAHREVRLHVVDAAATHVKAGKKGFECFGSVLHGVGRTWFMDLHDVPHLAVDGRNHLNYGKLYVLGCRVRASRLCGQCGWNQGQCGNCADHGPKIGRFALARLAGLARLARW